MRWTELDNGPRAGCCEPSCTRWLSCFRALMAWVIREVSEGEELSIAYLPPSASRRTSGAQLYTLLSFSLQGPLQFNALVMQVP